MHLFGLIIKTFVTMHGHMNVKFGIPYILTFYALHLTKLKKKIVQYWSDDGHDGRKW